MAGYRLLGGLGDGGQGSVFLGRDAGGARVAVKVLHARLLGDAHAERRFLQESATAARVAGFCTANVLDSGLVDGRPYIVSEFIEGPSLHEQVMTAGPLSGGELERLAVGTITALSAIHGAGIVHRDFKPSNILMGPDGPRVIDFGIAKAMDATTTASSVVGTPGYMAPEQIAGENVTAASDVFSWASTMGFAATGEPLFGRDSIPAVMNRILNAEPELGAVGEPLRSVLRACLSKDPAVRPTTDDVLKRLLRRADQTASLEPDPNPHTTPAPAPNPHTTPARRRGGRRRSLAGKRSRWAIAGALVAVGLVTTLLWQDLLLPDSGASPSTTVTAGERYADDLGPAFAPRAGSDVEVMAIGYNGSSPMVAYADRNNNTINVWEARGGQMVDNLANPGKAPVTSIGLTTVGGKRSVVWTGADGILRRWRIGRPKQDRWQSVCTGAARMSLARWREHAVAVVACPNGRVVPLDLDTGRMIGEPQQARGPITALGFNGLTGRPLIGTLNGVLGGANKVIGKGEVRSLATVGSNLVAITVGDSTGLYQLGTGKYVRGFTTGTAGVGVTSVNNTRNLIATGGRGLTMWNADGSGRRTLLDPRIEVDSLAVGDGLLVAEIDGEMRAWNLDEHTQ
ncbi:serine/threonine-protein kinase [Nonomuraea sp. NPDC050404]|uniref:serine/threonine-protein kinase n=1 Tax=Nonomuraea sp. NPDC050404 TaxID=3155783 RepID=UPI0033C0B840